MKRYNSVFGWEKITKRQIQYTRKSRESFKPRHNFSSLKTGNTFRRSVDLHGKPLLGKATHAARRPDPFTYMQLEIVTHVLPTQS